MEELRSVLRFGIHAVIGIALFVLVAGATVALSWVGDWVAARAMNPLIVKVMHGIEGLIFAIDTFLLVAYLLKEAYVLLREMLKRAHKPEAG